MIRVVVADGQQLLREGLKKTFQDNQHDIEVVGEASNTAELMHLLGIIHPDIVILDICMPDRAGLEIVKDLRSRFPKIPILVLSVYPEDRFAVRTLRAGASGYLTKYCTNREIIDAVKRIVVLKRKYISTQVAEQLALQIDQSLRHMPHEGLSDREYQIFIMISAGKKVSVIASELMLSMQTVHTYRSRIKKKLNMRSNVELARYALQHGLIE